MGRHVEYFETSAVPQIRKNENGDKLEFNDPYEGFAMFPNITIEDTGVKTLHGTKSFCSIPRC